MPRYFFHVGGCVLRPDDNGVELATAAEAWDEALQYAADLRAELDSQLNREDWHIVVEGQDGSFLFRLDFKPAS